jgi:hypothetical protein
MSERKKKIKSKQMARTKVIGVRLNPKIHYLAELAARYQQRTLSGFIEWAVTRALTPTVMQEAEPNVSEPLGPTQPRPLWMEGLWDVDEADRFLLLTSRTDLMTIEEQTLWKLLSEKLSRKNGKFNRLEFRALWNEFVGGARRDAGIE